MHALRRFAGYRPNILAVLIIVVLTLIAFDAPTLAPSDAFQLSRDEQLDIGGRFCRPPFRSSCSAWAGTS